MRTWRTGDVGRGAVRLLGDVGRDGDMGDKGQGDMRPSDTRTQGHRDTWGQSVTGPRGVPEAPGCGSKDLRGHGGGSGGDIGVSLGTLGDSGVPQVWPSTPGTCSTTPASSALPAATPPRWSASTWPSPTGDPRTPPNPPDPSPAPPTPLNPPLPPQLPLNSLTPPIPMTTSPYPPLMPPPMSVSPTDATLMTMSPCPTLMPPL